MGQAQIFIKITPTYSKNCYDFVTFTTQILIFTINCSNFHKNLNLSYSYYVHKKMVIFPTQFFFM